jgi:hypothetical protein
MHLDLSDMSVFEFGSGNSTIWWAGNALKVHSVEDDSTWFLKIQERINKGRYPIKYDLKASKDDYLNAYIGVYDITIIDGKFRSDCVGKYLQNSNYGDGVPLTRIEGKGNGNNDLLLSSETEAIILANNNISELTYAPGKGPVQVKVVDPLRVPSADFELRLKTTEFGEDTPDSMYWDLENLDNGTIYGT